MTESNNQKEWKHPNLPPRPFTFPVKVSHLDIDSPSSSINQSKLRGFFNIASIFAIIFFVTKPIINFIDHGYLLEATLYNTVKVDLLFCLFNWPLFFVW